MDAGVMPPAAQPRLRFAPLAAALLARFPDRTVDLGSQVQVMAAPSIVRLCERLGWSPRSWHRCAAADEIPLRTADRLAAAAGLHLELVWPADELARLDVLIDETLGEVDDWSAPYVDGAWERAS